MEPAHRALIPRPPPGGGLSSPAQRSSTEIDKNAERRFIIVHTTGLSARKGLLSTSLVLVSFTLFTAAMFAGGELADSMQQARETATFAEIHQQSFEPVYYRELGVTRLLPPDAGRQSQQPRPPC